jgi:putative ABC transport system permease protein
MRRWIDRIGLRLRAIMHGGDLDAAMRGEMQLHIDEQTAENIAAGMSRAEARAAAVRAFGPAARLEEECRDARRVAFISNFVQDLRYTFRSLARQPLLVTTATLSIAVAVSANATIFNLGNEFLLSAPTAHRPDQLVHIRMDGNSHVSYRQWRDLNESGALAGAAGYQIEAEVNWQGPSQSVVLAPLLVTANYFDLLGVPVAMGRSFGTAEAQAERQPHVVVISHGFWRHRLGGSPDVVGTALVFNGQPYTVLGVLPSGLRTLPGYGVAPEVYLPLNRELMPDLNEENSAAVQLVGRLHDGQSIGAGRAALNAAATRLDQQAGQNAAGKRKMLRASVFAPVGGFGQITEFREIGLFFAVLLVGAALILATACANVAGLLLARSTVRRREIAIRVALGAGRLRLVQQLLTEGLWIGLIGTSAGLLLMILWVRLLGSVSLPIPVPIELHVTFDGRVLAYSMFLLLFTTLLCGLAPAVQATRPSLVPALKQEELLTYRRWSLRGLLVVGQVAVALVLLVTAVLFLRNLGRAQVADPGFDTERTLVAQIGFVEGRYTPETRAAFLDQAVARLQGLPGIESAAYARSMPLTIRSGMTTGADLRIAGRGGPFNARYEVNLVGPGYFRTMGIRVERGREFLQMDKKGAPVVAIVNEEFVRRHMPGGNPVGQQLMLPMGPDTSYAAEIVGVVANGKHRTIGEAQQAAVYESFLQRGNRDRLVHVIVRTAQGATASAHDVQRLLEGMDPSSAVDVQTMRSALAFAFMPSQVGAALLGVLGALGLVLAMAGLYAMVAYSVSRRTAEIGIRVALGATPRAVTRLVLGDAGLLAGVGILLGTGGAMFLTRPLAMFLVTGLGPNDPVTFVATGLVLGLVCLAAAWVPARRALAVDPVRALRDQ